MQLSSLTARAIEYLGQWAQDADQFDDYRIFYERGFFDLCAARIVSAGAVESDESPAARNILAVAKRYSFKREQREINEALDGVAVFSCRTCNAVSFVDLESVGMEQEEFKAGGCYCCRSEAISFERIWRKTKKKA